MHDRYDNGGNAFEVTPEPDPATGVPAWQMRVYTGDGSFTVSPGHATSTL